MTRPQEWRRLPSQNRNHVESEPATVPTAEPMRMMQHLRLPFWNGIYRQQS